MAGDHIEIELPGARALFTTRRGGVSRGPFASLNLGLTTQGPAHDGRADERDHVAANRRLLAQQVGIGAEHFAHGHQVHGRAVTRITEAPRGTWSAAEVGNVPQRDGQATALGGVAAIVVTADCLPVALAAEGAVAMIHAGWRGLAAGVLAEGVTALRDLGARGPVVAAIGPGAGRCCYEVGAEVHAAFDHHEPDVRDGRHLDLRLIAARELAREGVLDLHDLGLCTMCADASLFFSHRRDGGVTGRQAGVVWRS
jgi:YfiH family protein